MIRERRHSHPDPVVQALADDLADLQAALRGGLGSGVTVAGLDFTAATARVVAHRLGRRPTGFVVVRAIDDDPGLYCAEADWLSRDARTITLTPTNTATADVVFF